MQGDNGSGAGRKTGIKAASGKRREAGGRRQAGSRYLGHSQTLVEFSGYHKTKRGKRLVRTLVESSGASSLSDLTLRSLISLSFSSYLINKKRNNISMLRVSKTSSPTGC